MRDNETASILVIDDDRQKLMALETVLEALGQRIVCVTSGHDALRLLLQQNFAVILLDVNMPGMDGFETASLIRQRRNCEAIPIIFITAYGDDLFVERGYSLGAVDYILTPIVPDVLRSKVSVFVELYRQTEQIRRQARRLEQRSAQLSALANQLADAENRERRRLAHILHDDFQQLLVAAKMRLSAAAPQVLQHRAHAVLQPVHDLIDQSINMSRSLAIELSPPILHQGGLENAINWLARRFERDHALKVRVTVEPGVPDLGESLRAFFYQCVRELLFNVVKHAGVDEAALSVRVDDGVLEVSVEDQGHGFRTPVSDMPMSDGEHFGLSSMRQRIHLLDGTFRLEANEGVGARVTLRVPLSRDAANEPANCPVPQRASTAASNTIRVLLVDDHELLRTGLRVLLEAHADVHVVGEAGDGLEAIERARELHPDVIIMDMSMPRMDGVTATRRIVADVPNVQIIGLSMHGTDDVDDAMRRAGAVGYLSKTAPPDRIVAAIRATRQVEVTDACST